MIRLCSAWLMLAILSLFASGCCCVQGVSSQGTCGISSCATGGCATGACGAGPLASLASCRGACGDIYVDEWISEPPTIDNCGYPCGGCGQCRQCTPVRSLLRLLWGRPYMAGCCTGMPSCGCDSCGGGFDGGYAVSSHGASCDCGDHHSAGAALHPVPNIAPSHEVPAEEVVPTPAPVIEKASARRLNPAAQRRVVRRDSHLR